ncbi:hypothetical protein MIND_00629300 [Mycena indigotica]|uniref:BTB domain-containing protein n=1 Tax=Mycena indigotica TaxID=2126181 RepID=A0A8H6SRP7_9AGAR|nr:uncharacterized protein MIND_00629300 [Mycena indigotica]KAF7303983.1 hypothetical protein MIND_00629300 [Mycena indigotica]
MLSFPQPTDTMEDDRVDGCPRIILQDSAHDVTCFFRAIFDSSFFVPSFSSPPPLATLAAILRLSQKYDVEYLRQRCLAHLSSLYPTSLDAWDSLNYAKHILGLHCRQSPPTGTYPILPVLELAKEAMAPWIAPAIMYLGLCAGVEGILDGTALNCHPGLQSGMSPVPASAITLTTEQRMLIVAYPALLSATAESVSFLLSPPPSHMCFADKVYQRVLVTETLGRLLLDWDAVREDVCDVCVKQARRLHAESREKFWDALPKLVGVGHSWSELEKLKETAFS